jgi:5-methylcytosine-specific restriction endonuclease McrA
VPRGNGSNATAHDPKEGANLDYDHGGAAPKPPDPPAQPVDGASNHGAGHDGHDGGARLHAHAYGRPPPRRSDPLGLPVLVVNRFFQPVQITSARRAFLLLFGGAALAIDELGEMHDFGAWRSLPVRPHDDELPVVGGALRVPRVLHLRRYERVRRPVIRLTRKNVMLRDAHQCQYCGRRPPVRDLNIDHVLPRSRGGADSWENLVTACRLCNLRKGWKTPEEAMMRLLRIPGPPRWTSTMQILLGTPSPFEEWAPFLKAG